MSQVRDNVNLPQGLVPNAPTDGDTDAVDTQSSAQATGPSDAQLNLRHARLEDDRQTQQKDFQADFNKKLTDPPGFGANEDADAAHVKAGMAAANFSLPTSHQVQVVNNAVGQTKEFNTAVATVRDAITGEGPVPTAATMTKLLSKVGAADTTGQLNVPQTVNTAVQTQETAAAQDPSAPAAGGTQTQGTPAANSDDDGLPATSSMSALVFLVILAAQRENVKEKNDVLRKIKMYNGMLDQVNQLVNSQLIPAQKEMADLRDAGKSQKNFKPDQIQVPVNYPYNIDTQNASMNADTGEVVLNCQWSDGKGGPSRRLVNSADLSSLIQQADQTRTSIQNNQQQQSNRFQSKDNQMSSAWNILNAVLKNTHDGVSSTVKNI